jgi:hypothetical protein
MSRVAKLAAALIVMAGIGSQASAQPRHHEERDWRDRDIHRFHEHDFDRWRAGHWWRGRHGGRAGWWWVVGPSWYFYPEPVYPYPDPYQPPAVVAPPAPARLYYYCDNPRGYYPYVPACRTPWRGVPAG